MADKIQLSEDAYKGLMIHLAEVREGKNRFIGEHFPEPSKERVYFNILFDEYIETLDNLVENTVVTEASDNCLPVVTVGSEVEVEDLEMKETYKFNIVLPKPDKTSDEEISFLSPVGSSLLSRKVGDTVKVNAPRGVFYYQVKSISFNPSQLID